ncbi:MAG: hypothetical protein ACKVWR_16460 [Acidimicrobiales bacterium]
MTLAEGTGVAVAAIGMFQQPNAMRVSVPGDAAVNQVLLYWEAGRRPEGAPLDASISVNGRAVTGRLIGGPTHFYDNVDTATHRADITGLGLVGPGDTTLTVDGLDAGVNDGAGVVVIYEMTDALAEVQLVDGNDIAFVNFAAPRDTTAPQTFTFEAAADERPGVLSLLAASVHDPAPGTPQDSAGPRPHTLVYTVGGVTRRLVNPMVLTADREFDAGQASITIPAGADRLTVQMLSEPDGTDHLPASLVWQVAALAVPAPEAVEGGGVTKPPTVTPEVPEAPEVPETDVAATEVAGEVVELPVTGPDRLPLAAAAAGAALVLTGAVAFTAARRRRSALEG